MLFEDFLNRHIRPELNRLSFPSRIFPFFIIVGILMQVVLPIFPILGREVLPNWPGLFRAVGLTGLGLIGGSIAVGCMWGLLKERIGEGYLRPNFGSAFFFYSVVLIACWFIVYFFAGAFFYNYPSQRYRSFIMEVKPSPELKAEIENLGLYDIKKHTPYDYSLDRQTIRYDFLERRGRWNFRSREGMFRRTTTHYSKDSSGWVITSDGDQWVSKGVVDFPEFIVVNDNYFCGVNLAVQSPSLDVVNKLTGQVFKLEKLKDSVEGGVYDVTAVFKPDVDLEFCTLRRTNLDKKLEEILITQLFLPEIHKGVLSVVFGSHRHWDFGMKHFKEAVSVF